MREELSGDRYSITRAQYQENKVNMKETSNSLILQKEQVDIGTYKRFICGFLDILEPLTKLKKKYWVYRYIGILLGKVHRLLKILVTKNKTELKVAVTRTKQHGKKFGMLMSKFLNVRVQCSFLIKSLAQVF